ncbi:MAG: uroporphyrinogen-III synthase [Sphingomonas sp.]|uniref:uroporphyrinogen-III synthase n=1 Tax=Sphingomonas sp. TaxID=28214 RepID=UPI0018264F19|nr:uroporphyrinogen-III synthase [Sphingomonas sp.]MBA3667454.1 uroporphyrinogen-III synthase [Sphingomonas sp.]
MRRLLLLRPEPGLSLSAARASDLGLDPILTPLFAVQAVGWTAPDPAGFDALLVTSANAMRHAGPQIAKLTPLSVHAVGEATATAAREAGFQIASVGNGDVDALLAGLPRSQRLLHLTGGDHRDPASRHIVESLPVYRAAAIPDPHLPSLTGLVAAVHSPRAGARLADLAPDRGDTIIAAISSAAATACGGRWQQIAIAELPDDVCLLALAARLCHTFDPE